ncbi:MAG: PAS domain S-box protein [Chloroflexi bacterium]|nr:PAS domain S-box protein [Chloroflexota bacterium]
MQHYSADEERTTRVEPSPENIIDNSPIGLYIVQDGKFQMVNLQFQKETGHTETELLGMESLRLVHPEDREAVRVNAILMLKGHRTSPYEYRVLKKDDEIIHILETVTSIEYRGKRAAFGNFMNITERKLAEEKAQRLGQTLRLLGQIGQLVLENDEEEELLRKACVLIIASQNYKLVWIGFIREGSPEVTPVAHAGFDETFLSSLRRGVDNPEYGSGPADMAVKMGRPFVIRDVANDPWYRPWREEALVTGYRSAAALPLKVGDEMLGALTVCSRYADAFDAEELALLSEIAGNISLGIQRIRQAEQYRRANEALRQSEEILRLMFESLADGVTVVDLEGRIVRVNEAKVRMHGCDSKEELIGKRLEELVVEKDLSKLHENRTKVLNGTPLQHVEYTFRRKDGREFSGEASTAIIRNAAGQPIGFIWVSRDITEFKKLEERLLVADRLASVGELASGIAHEINNPLTSILGFAELLFSRQDLPEDAIPDLEIIRRESHRAATTVRNLLAFARGQTTAKAPLDVNTAIQNVLSLRAYQHRANNIQVVTHLADNLPPVTADSFQFQQTLINIIINAEYFMVEAHGKGTLTITAEMDDKAVRVSIADDGPGIAKKDLGRIFDPFFTTKAVGKGTGLGLSLCHGIIAEHGGQLYCESEPGQGALFTIKLPPCLKDWSIEHGNHKV